MALLKAARHPSVTAAVMPQRDHGTIISAIGAPDDRMIASVLAFLRATARPAPPGMLPGLFR